MEWSILFMGPVGSGKTQAIKTLSDIEVAGTEAIATDETADMKQFTTVSMDAGVLELGAGVEYWHNMFGKNADKVPGARQLTPIVSLVVHLPMKSSGHPPR